MGILCFLLSLAFGYLALRAYQRKHRISAVLLLILCLTGYYLSGFDAMLIGA